MSDYLAAQITIGGCISRALAPRLCRLIDQANLLLDWDEPFAPQTAEELLTGRRVIDGEWLLQLTCNDAPYGALPDLEAILVEHKIPFDRQSDAGYGYDGALVVYRPGREPVQFLATSRGEPAAPVAALWELEERLRDLSHLVNRGSRRELHSALRHMLALCWEAAPCRPDPLPSFEIGKSVGLRKAA